MTESAIQVPDHTQQVKFHALLVIARKTWLMDALSETLGNVDHRELKSQLIAYVPDDVQKILAAADIRDEHVFPTPLLLEAQPTLVGYYRLLLGLSQKAFYRGGTGRGGFKSMETRGRIRPAQRAGLPALCQALAPALAALVREITPRIVPRDVSELPLLTLGDQLQGGNNNTIGQLAMNAVYEAITQIVVPHLIEHSPSQMRIRNAQGREFLVAVAGDPDVRVQEIRDANLVNLLSIEVKGGTDRSNAYNRGGEAEKSHQAARNAGYGEFWTIINRRNVDVAKLKAGSPTTSVWFETTQIVAQSGSD